MNAIKRQNNGLFVVGTDTEVGKTFVGIHLLRLLKTLGRHPVPFKPFESGTLDTPMESDAFSLWSACFPEESMASWVCPFHFKHPLAPARAAKLENKGVDLDTLRKNFQTAKSKGDFILVEGCGGLLVPLLPNDLNYTIENLILEFNLPVLIIARAGLGTINHTLLTYYRLQDQNIPSLGVVLNQPQEETGRDHAIADNVKTLQEILPIPVWGPLLFSKRSGDSIATTHVAENQKILQKIVDVLL